MSQNTPRVEVRLPATSTDRRYPIYIGRGTLEQGEILPALLGDRDVCLVTNETIGPLYEALVLESLGDQRKVTRVLLPDGESHKTLQSFGAIVTAALEDQQERSCVFIALGGGVVGDITGFAAAAFLRGADFIQIPTTLLAQVDSSVGGKTAINHPMGKNLIGAFHQPIGVIIDTMTLNTLSEREFAAGLAEVVKYGLIADAHFFHRLLESVDALKRRDQAMISEVISRCCEIKADIVNQDEREGGIRAVLNFGHTFGHAIERELGFGQWLHGEAVAVGMVIATRISVARGHVDVQVLDGLVHFLASFNLPTSPPPEMGLDDFMRAMQGDKKVQSGKIRFVLLDGLGQACVTADVDQSEIAASL